MSEEIPEAEAADYVGDPSNLPVMPAETPSIPNPVKKSDYPLTKDGEDPHASRRTYKGRPLGGGGAASSPMNTPFNAT